MMMKKLAIASAVALMSMGSVYAQQTTVTTTNAQTATETGGLMSSLSTSVNSLFASGRLSNAVDITALGGAVNLAAINGGINITGVNVNLSGVTGALTGLSTTVIGSMNSSTLDIAKSVTTLSDKTGSTLNIAGLANQGPGPTVTSQGFGPGQLTLATTGNSVLASAAGSTQFDMHGLTSSTDTLASSVTDKLQTMNVFNMAVNMAPLVAGVNIAATVNSNAWFLNPDNGSVKLSGLQVATTSIGAMNSSITRLGAKLSN